MAILRSGVSGLRRVAVCGWLGVGVGCLVALGIRGTVLAQGDRVISVRAEGFGTIIDGDVAQAHSRAEADARIRALAKAAGVYVESQTLVRNQLLLDTAVRSKTAGFIRDYRVLAHGKVGEGQYRVEIEARIVSKTFEGRLKNLLSNASVIVRIPEKVCGRDVEGPSVENEIISALADEGFRVLDREQAQRIRRRDVVLMAQKRDRDAVTRTALRFLSNVIVAGIIDVRHGQVNFGIYTNRIGGNVRVLEAETAKILLNKRPPRRIRGVGGLSCEDAAGKTLEKLAPQMSRLVLQKLNEHLKRNRRKVSVEAKGLTSAKVFRRLQFLVKEMAWVTEVNPVSYREQTGRLTLLYPEKVVYLATSLNRRKEYEVVSFDYNTIFLKAKP